HPAARQRGQGRVRLLRRRERLQRAALAGRMDLRGAHSAVGPPPREDRRRHRGARCRRARDAGRGGGLPRELLPARLPAEDAMRRAPRSAQRGIALVLVIWLATLLTVVAASFAFSARTDALVIRNSISMARAEAAADAGVARAVWESYRIDNSPEQWRRDGAAHDMAFDDALVRVEMRDESARIDINTASDALLRGLMVSIGLTDEEAT